jgi:hypothetical protein
VGGEVVGGVAGAAEVAGGVDGGSSDSGEVDGGKDEGEAEVEVEIEVGGGESGCEPAFEADVDPSSGPDVEATCPDPIGDAPLSGGAAAMVPAKTSARRKSLLTRAPSSSRI